MSRLLDLLDRQISDLEAGRDHDYRLMSDIIDYFTHYPSTSHHPLEDQMFKWVSRERPDLAGFVDDLAKEHEAQAVVGREVALFVRGILAGHLVMRDKIVASLREFSDMQRAHINKEEAFLLKETEQLLRDRGVDEIPIADEFVADTLFSEKPDAAYADLLAALAG